MTKTMTQSSLLKDSRLNCHQVGTLRRLKRPIFSNTLQCKHQNVHICRSSQDDLASAYDSETPLIEAETIIANTQLPTQGDAMVAGIDQTDYINRQLQEILKPPSTDYLAVGRRLIIKAVIFACIIHPVDPSLRYKSYQPSKLPFKPHHPICRSF